MNISGVIDVPAQVRCGMVPVNGTSMYYATFGAGDPVSMILGGLGHADLWGDGAQVVDLMQDHLVIVADSSGHAASAAGIHGRDPRLY